MTVDPLIWVTVGAGAVLSRATVKMPFAELPKPVPVLLTASVTVPFVITGLVAEVTPVPT